MFFPFIIHHEHRLSVQAVVLSGVSVGHGKEAVLKQFDLKQESKGFKKELEVLAKIQIKRDLGNVGLPELLGFAYGLTNDRAELLMSHCGRDLNQEWLKYMESRQNSNTYEFKVKISQMGY